MILDGVGRLVDVVVSGQLPAGKHSVSWSADGKSTGVYIFMLEAHGKRMISKGMLVR